MTTRFIWAIGVAFTTLAVACDGDEKPAADTTADVADTAEPDTTEPDTTVPDTTEADTTVPDTTEADTSAPDTADKTTWSAVYPIFKGKCAPCHAGIEPDDGAGGHAIASGDESIAYQASQLAADVPQCTGKKIGECAIIRILNGSMPQGKNCGTNPTGAGCLTEAEKQLIQDWIQDGMLR